MASHTTYRWNCISSTSFEMEEFFIDFCCHFQHIASHLFFWFCITGKIHFETTINLSTCMTVISCNAKGVIKSMHNLVEIFMADVFGKHFQVPFRSVLWRSTGCYTQGYSYGQKEYNIRFLVHKHLCWCEKSQITEI